MDEINYSKTIERKTEFVEDLLVFLKTLSSDEFNNFALRSATTKKDLNSVFFSQMFLAQMQIKITPIGIQLKIVT